MSSLDQEESRSISENCTWGIRKKFEEGKVRMAFGNFLGCEKDKDGNIVIKEREAKEVPNVREDVKLYGSTIKSMLQNEKYTGNAILQKTYSVDFLSKKETEK